jgi:cell wall-associated NlpC family hydrolase
MSGSASRQPEAPKVRRNWLAYAALGAVALSVPMAGVAQAAPLSGGQQGTAAQKVHKTNKVHETHRAGRHRRPHESKVHKIPKVHKAHRAGRHRRPYESFDMRAATYVQSMEGVPYVYGGTSPSGFDCSGLTQYVYGHLGKSIQRTAEDQFLQFRRISKARAWGGDLVFFHVSSDPNSYVYHVGVYEGGDEMVAATTYGSTVQKQSFAWAGDTVTFGTITH